MACWGGFAQRQKGGHSWRRKWGEGSLFFLINDSCIGRAIIQLTAHILSLIMRAAAASALGKVQRDSASDVPSSCGLEE